MTRYTHACLLSFFLIGGCATNQQGATSSSGPADPGTSEHNRPPEVAEPAEASAEAEPPAANTSSPPAAERVREPSRPCRSAHVETEERLVRGKAHRKDFETTYEWDDAGYLRRSRTETRHTKYGTTWSERTYRHDSGVPLELRTVGEAISLEGKVMGRSDQIHRWSWRDGVLTALSFEDVGESITMRMELDFEWPAGTTATSAGVAPVELMTWIDDGHQNRRQLYMLYYAGAAGRPEVTSRVCKRIPRREPECEERRFEIEYDEFGRLEKIVTDEQEMAMSSGPFGPRLMVVNKDTEDRVEREETTWTYTEDGLLLRVAEDTSNSLRSSPDAVSRTIVESVIARDDAGRATSRRWRYLHRGEPSAKPGKLHHQWTHDCDVGADSTGVKGTD